MSGTLKIVFVARFCTLCALLRVNYKLLHNYLNFLSLMSSHSFGYDCQGHYNLCVADENTLVFFSGVLLHFFNLSTKTLTFMKSLSGSGIGHVVVSKEAYIQEEFK